jgi:hypothetical protein
MKMRIWIGVGIVVLLAIIIIPAGLWLPPTFDSNHVLLTSF